MFSSFISVTVFSIDTSINQYNHWMAGDVRVHTHTHTKVKETFGEIQLALWNLYKSVLFTLLSFVNYMLYIICINKIRKILCIYWGGSHLGLHLYQYIINSWFGYTQIPGLRKEYLIINIEILQGSIGKTRRVALAIAIVY